MRPAAITASTALLAMAAVWAVGAGRSGGAEPARPASAPRWNVLLVTLDTLRADRIGIYGHPEVKTPALDGLAAQGVVFRNAYAAAPLTLPSHTTLMTGRYPAAHGVHDNGGYFVREQDLLLAEILKQRGYRTAAAVGSFVLHSRWGIAQGFDAYADDFSAAGPEQGVLDPLWLQKRGDQVLDRALELLGTRPKEPFFLWVHLYDPHYPYAAPEPYAGLYGPASYEAEVAFTDALVGELLAEIGRRGLEPRTLVVVAADHGEGLGDHGESTHAVLIYEEVMRVPLILRLPDRRFAGRAIDPVVRLADLLPTVLELLDAAAPAGIQGRSLVPLLRGQPLPDVPAYLESFYARYHYGWAELVGLRTSTHKLIRTTRPELYDLARDPEERHNLYRQQPRLAKALEAHLDRVRRRVGAADAAGSAPAQVDPATMAKLRALGYAGGSAPTVAAGAVLPDPKDHIAKLDRVLVQVTSAWQAIHDGKYEQAAAQARQVLQWEPTYADAFHILGVAELRRGRADAALEALKSGLRASPTSQPMKMALAQAYGASGDGRAAQAVLEELVAGAPEFAPARLALGLMLADQKRLDRALELLTPLLKDDEHAALASFRVGLIHLERNDAGRAEPLLRRAVAGGKKIPEAHFNLALLLESQGQAAEALAEYRAELTDFPRNDRAWQNLGLLLKARGEWQEAAAAFEQVTRLRPSDPAGFYLLASVKAQQPDQRSEVERLLRRCLELDPEYGPARRLLQQ